MSVVRLTDRVDDVRFETVQDCLVRVLTDIKEGFKSAPGFKPTSVVVVLLDQNQGAYRVLRDCSSMKTSQMIALLEIAKEQELRIMLLSAGS